MTHIDISPDEGAHLAHALEKHIRHLDRLLGKNAEWPKERTSMVTLLARLRRHALSRIDDIDDCPNVYADDHEFI